MRPRVPRTSSILAALFLAAPPLVAQVTPSDDLTRLSIEQLMDIDVPWDALDTFLLDIDRIEVIRGPGAALWGANAVNGVVNIITRSAEATAGGVADIAAGREERFLGSLRYGDTTVGGGHYRVFAKYVD